MIYLKIFGLIGLAAIVGAGIIFLLPALIFIGLALTIGGVALFIIAYVIWEKMNGDSSTNDKDNP